tara:strand:- start:743 stop:1153 length:411 start_codon:yes stop_codon:yes gene_type:complete
VLTAPINVESRDRVTTSIIERAIEHKPECTWDESSPITARPVTITQFRSSVTVHPAISIEATEEPSFSLLSQKGWHVKEIPQLPSWSYIELYREVKRLLHTVDWDEDASDSEIMAAIDWRKLRDVLASCTPPGEDQ